MALQSCVDGGKSPPMQGVMCGASESGRGTQMAVGGGNLRQSETVVDLAEIG